jgi:hypothetical protein
MYTAMQILFPLLHVACEIGVNARGSQGGET